MPLRRLANSASLLKSARANCFILKRMESHVSLLYRRQSLNMSVSNSKLLPSRPAFPLNYTFSLDTGGFSPSYHPCPRPTLINCTRFPPSSIQTLPNAKPTPNKLRRHSSVTPSLVQHHDSQPTFLAIPPNQQAKTGHFKRRSSDIPSHVPHRDTHQTRQSLNSTKVYVETEEELDALEKMVRPHRLRNTLAELPSKPLPELYESEIHETAVFLEVDLDSSGERKKKEHLHPMKFLNLPKLPFGQHSSYNEEASIREKIVSQRWKAWKRQPKAVPKRSF